MALHQRGEEVDTSQTFPPPAAVGNNDVVTGQRLSIVATSADHSAAPAASVGDNGDYDDEANKPLPRAGTTPMGEDDDDPIMTAWHRIGGSWRHPTPKPMVVGQHHRTSDKRGRGGGEFHIQRSTRNWQR